MLFERVEMARHWGVEPHSLAKDSSGRLWEFISYPWGGIDGVIRVLIRVPGDPTTVTEVVVPDDGIFAEGIDCECEKLGEFYLIDERNGGPHSGREKMSWDDRIGSVRI
jgi:hypothetical protein